MIVYRVSDNGLEFGFKHNPYAVFLCRGQVEIIEAAHIFNAEESEHIMHSCHYFNIWSVGIHDIGTLRKLHEHITTPICFEIGIILVCEISPQHLHTKILPPFEFLYQWHTIEYLAVYIPLGIYARIPIIEKLHIINKVKGSRLNDIREVGGRHDK